MATRSGARSSRPAGATGRLPTLLLIHGGPQGTFANAWSYRWNPRVFVAPGYGAVTVDFHGSTGYGQAFTDAINHDWGGAPLEDLRLGLAAAGREEPRLDTANACALGGSYGGFMVDWIAGNWPDGFKCLVSHDGVFDQRAMAYETEELWFNEWEFGGPYYSPTAARDLRAQQPGQFRAELAHADDADPWRARFPDSLQPVARRVQRAPAPRHAVAPDRLPRRESLGPEAAKLDPMVSRGPSLGRSVAQRGWRSRNGALIAAG